METGAVIVTVLQGAVFIAWAFLMFRSLFRLRRDVVQRAGRQGFYQPSVAETLTSFGWFLTEDRYARDRRILGVLTLMLFAMIALQAWMVRGA